MVTQILASLTSKPTLFVPHWSPHLGLCLTHCFPNTTDGERFALEASWENKGSYKPLTW